MVRRRCGVGGLSGSEMRLIRGAGGFCWGLDAYSSLELEYAEALRAGGIEGRFLIPRAKGFGAECVEGLFREAGSTGSLGGCGARGCGSRCQRLTSSRC
jgi:hypothetical protein